MAKSPLELKATLRDGTPLIEVDFAVGTTKQAALRGAGRRVPGEVRVMGYIDTGCSRTVIDYSVVQRLELRLTGSTTCRVAGGLHFVETCCLDARVNGFWEFKDLECAYFSNLRTDRYEVLLGLDILREFVLEFDGPRQQVILRKPGVPTARTDEPAYFHESANRFVRLVGGGPEQHYRDCGDCSILAAFGRRAAAKKLRQSGA